MMKLSLGFDWRRHAFLFLRRHGICPARFCSCLICIQEPFLLPLLYKWERGNIVTCMQYVIVWCSILLLLLFVDITMCVYVPFLLTHYCYYDVCEVMCALWLWNLLSPMCVSVGIDDSIYYCCWPQCVCRGECLRNVCLLFDHCASNAIITQWEAYCWLCAINSFLEAYSQCVLSI